MYKGCTNYLKFKGWLITTFASSRLSRIKKYTDMTLLFTFYIKLFLFLIQFTSTKPYEMTASFSFNHFLLSFILCSSLNQFFSSLNQISISLWVLVNSWFKYKLQVHVPIRIIFHGREILSKKLKIQTNLFEPKTIKVNLRIHDINQSVCSLFPIAIVFNLKNDKDPDVSTCIN